MNPADNDSAIDVLWRSMPGSAMPDRPATDLRGRRRRQLRIMWIEVLVVLGGLTIALALLIQGSIGLGVATLLYTLLAGILGLRTRRANLAVLDLSLADQLAANAARLRARRNHEIVSAVIWLAALGYFFAIKTLREAALDLPAQILMFALVLAIGFQVWRAGIAWREAAAFSSRANDIADEKA